MPDIVELYRQHRAFVWGSLSRLGVRAEDLEDVLQDVFVAVHRRLPEFDPARASLRTWLFSICRGFASNYRRSSKTRQEAVAQSAVEPLHADDVSPEEAAARAQAKARLDSILAEMSFEKRITFLMYEVDRMSTEDIAEILGIERGTVFSRLHAARREFERGVRRLQLLDLVKEKST